MNWKVVRGVLFIYLAEQQTVTIKNRITGGKAMAKLVELMQFKTAKNLKKELLKILSLERGHRTVEVQFRLEEGKRHECITDFRGKGFTFRK